MSRTPRSIVAVTLLLLLAAGCSEKGLRGALPGQTVDEAKAAFEPLSGEGSWSTRGDEVVWYGEKASPRELVLEQKSGRVAAVRAVFTVENLRAGGVDPARWEFDQRARLTKGAASGFEHRAVELSATAGQLIAVREDGGEIEFSLADRGALDLEAADCDGARGLTVRLDQAVAGQLGEEGLRPGAQRDAAILGMQRLAAAAELACPDASGVLTSVADFFQATGAANGARERYRKALKADADWGHRHASDAQGGLGTVTARYRQYEVADQAFRTAIELAPDGRTKARWARRFADVLHDRMEFGPAARYYKVYLEAVGEGGDPSDSGRVWARLGRALLQTEGGCTPAAEAVEKGLAIEGASERARSAVLASKAFCTIACEPKKKKAAYADLQEAVKLDPLMAAEYATLAGYYDREANDEAILNIMVDQGWLDRGGLRDARAYQQSLRSESRGE